MQNAKTELTVYICVYLMQTPILNSVACVFVSLLKCLCSISKTTWSIPYHIHLQCELHNMHTMYSTASDGKTSCRLVGLCAVQSTPAY